MVKGLTLTLSMESAREIRVLEIGRQSSAARASRAWQQLKRIVPAILGLFASTIMAPGIAAQGVDNPIIIENQQPGSTAWRLTPSLISDDATGQIKGYASATSVNQNESITLYVTVNPAQTYTIDVFRMGWYAGLGGRLFFHAGPLNGVQQSACATDPTTGLIACNWVPSYTLTIPSDWTSGIYLALLTNAAGYQNYVMFVVRDGRPAAFLYQQSVITDQAYNNYPDDGRTGKSLYTYNSYGANTVAGDPRAVKVSFDRPYTSHGAGNLPNWEIELVRWLERTGYDVTYSTDIDTHANGGALLSSRGFISGGHDEYWSKEMFDAVEAARDAGVNLAFFGADVLSVQVRVEASAMGVPNRVIVCYKDASIDPVQGPTTTVAWRNPPVNRPEQPLRGIQGAFTTLQSNVGYVVTNSSHWAYAGTGLRDGDVVPGIVGYEMDRFWPNFPPPNSRNQTILSQSPFTDSGGVPSYANSSIYQAPSGAWVFSAGTLSWSWGLDNFYHNVADARIQQTTANILNAFLSGAPGAPTITAQPVSQTVTAGQTATFSVTASGTAPLSYQWEKNGTAISDSGGSSASYTTPATTTSDNGAQFTVVVSNSAGSATSDTATLTVNAPRFMLAVSETGLGSGTVTSSPAGINCGSTCSTSFVSGTTVTLTATPNLLSSFGGWGGCDSASGTTCTVNMNAGRSVTASFTLLGLL
ncbi:MAG TPA: N,N-dimethylformamidase beta subunit family domain-containing protein [Terriglobales bacterium]|nr:N,N-dimethylformamidase beta subunit family domain-containing protein [Terriglobales bacterium]